jgi:hypothetical protein
VRAAAFLAAASLAGLALVLAGCGGEDAGSAAPAAERPSKQEFIAAADLACTEAGVEYDAAIADLPPFEEIVAPDVSRRVMLEVGGVAPRIAAVERALEQRLRALEPPAQLAARWDRALDTLEARAVAAEDIQAAARAGDRNAYLSAFQRFDREGSISSEALRGYGFEICAAG